MKTATTVCGKCGAKIPDDTRREVCPACLLETGLGLLSDEPVAGVGPSAVAAYSAEAAAKAGSAKADDPGRPASSRRVGTIARTAEVLVKFGDFEIARREDGSTWELGRGGMGATYRARDNVLHRSVALKVIEVPPEVGNSEVVRERFLREARAAAALRHPNVAAVYHFGTVPEPDRCYYAMELVEGETLEARVRREGPLKIAQVLEIGVQVTRALTAAANQGLIHRDLKPANIMLTRSEDSSAGFEVKVIDFGLAKVTAESFREMDLTHGGFVGTPNFASPEQFESGPIDVRSDIYSLGATLWFALTGKTPFAGRNIEGIRSAQKSNVLPVEQLKAARVPSSSRSLLRSMLAFELAARPGIQDLAAQLRRCSALADIEMAADGKKEIQLEIAHVLFIDIVGYSKLSINEEQAAVDELTQIVRSTEQFQKAEAAERLIKIPSGDGMALVFYTSPEAPVRCAMQISRALKQHPRVHIRMGIHSGPVSGVVDVTGRSNLAGAGLNLAQRVMKCGDAGHILLSKRVAEDLSEFDEWRPLLHDLGRCEVKHGVQVTVVNLCSDDVGNRQLPQKFQTFRKQRTRVRWAEVAAALLLLAGIVAAFVLVSKKSARSTSIAPEKSIAVLPFENLSEDKANAYFADGIQEEILSRLAKIADLKVISRTSTQRYQSKPANLSEIAKQLGVANILEGSIQKSGDQVRVNVQLLNAQTDFHLWADTYDRKLTDIFGVESEIAKGIAESLQAKLTGREEQALAVKPTNNPEAYDAYLRGLAFDARGIYSVDDIRKAIDSYERAVELDPNFAIAWARLSRGHAFLYFRPGATAARRDAAKSALENAQKLQPNSPETLLALGYSQYWVLRDYGLAKTTFGHVSKMLPGSSEVPLALGAVTRREGHWNESVAYFEQALALDPRNVELLNEAAFTFVGIRQFPAALKLFDRALDITPNDPDLMAVKASVYQAQGNLREAAELLSQINAQTPSESAIVIKWTQLKLERNYAEAIRLLQARQAQFHFASETNKAITQVLLVFSQRLAGDTAGAKAAAEQARNTLEQLCKNQPDSAFFAVGLSLVYAMMREKDLALKEAERAITLLPSSKDRVEGPALEENLALIQTMFGENSQAISTLARLLPTPYNGWVYLRTPVTPALLKLDPIWDSLRADPAFQKLCEEKPPFGSEVLTQSAPEKSIAVLPFENLSEEKANAYFAEGIQEEILTRLAKIADLKVISRTSTQKYKSSPDNLREIAQQLGVANILEGSVQKAADQVRVNVQLINAATDAHLWAETYDRKLTDIFGVESEIAKGIAESLQAKLTGREEQALAVKPTNNPEAYDAYLRGLAFDTRSSFSADALRKAVDSYERAVELDTNFALVWARLSRADASLYFYRYDTTAARRDAAKKSLETAQKLQPSSPETLLALGYYQYLVLRDYELAKTTFKEVSKLLPSSSEVPRALGSIARREGHWDESIAYLEQGLALDPRNSELLSDTAFTYTAVRQFPAALKLYDRELDIIPNDPDLMGYKASIYQAEGNLQEAAKLLLEINPQTPSTNAFITKIIQLRLERNYSEAVQLLQARQTQFHFDSESHKAVNQLILASTQRLASDIAGAQATAEQARNMLGQLCKDQPDNSDLAGMLALANAVLGEKNSALNEIQRAIMLLPSAKDRVHGPAREEGLALIQVTFGENSSAISTLTHLLQTPYVSWIYGVSVTPALLRFDPFWDPLRADPAFQKLCGEKQP